MYNGLFGDLPSTKKASETNKDAAVSSGAAAAQKTQAGDKNKLETVVAGNEDNIKPKKTKAETTTPRFVPLQMKRPRKAAVVPKKKKVSKSKGDAGVVVVDMSQERETTKEMPVKEDIAPNSLPEISPPLVKDGNGTLGMVNGDEAAKPTNKEKQTNVSTNDEAAVADAQVDNIRNVNIAEEPEYLRELHEQAKEDLYNPMVPNDLLHYWEHQRSIQEKERLLLEQQMALREHERMRQALEEERQRLQAEGDFDKIVEHTVQQQQGRKISNVPAWLLEQQRAQKETKNGGES